MADKEREWANIVNMPDEQALTLLQRQYEEIAGLDEEERRSRLQGMAEVEYSLPDEALNRCATSRLRAWARMDQAAAKRVSDTYDAVMNTVHGTVAMRRMGVDQTAARELSVEEQAQLQQIIPRLFPGMDMKAAEEVKEEPVDAMAEAVAEREREREAVGAGAGRASGERKPWWAFWRG